MRYIIELPISRVQAIQSLINSRKYEGIQSFILTAIENQLYLERQPAENLVGMQIAEDRAIDRKYKGYLFSPSVSRPTSALPDTKVVDEPQPEALGAETLWALYNRIFPVKITLRVLMNMLKANPESGFVDLWSVQDAATDEARKLRRKLVRIDRKSHRDHGDKLSTGLPKKGDRSGDRFKFHFVGSINSKKHLEGAPAILRFVNIKRDEQGRPQVGLTKAGLEFAFLENPILDRANYTHTLSKEESDFYLRHIYEKLPKEYALSIGLLSAIKAGHNTPNELNEEITKLDSNIKEREAHAVRSSLIGRLSELGLLIRKRFGLKVTYILTDRGREIQMSRSGS